MIKVTTLLAQGPGQPDGDVDDRLTLRLCLTQQGQIDLDAFQAAPSPWLALRQRPGRDGRTLEIIRIDEGWALQSARSEDDPIWAMEGHVFRPGELVRLRRPDSQELLFRIVSVEQE